jgi:hypothetical protein
MYQKRWMTLLVMRKSEDPYWIRWVHQSEGKTHCEECLMLDGCLFLRDRTPPWPHHPNCHCILEPVDYTEVLLCAEAHSDYSKFDPYLFNTQGKYHHQKEKLFHQWGYTVEDARWLQSEIEKQALEKYYTGDYTLGKLDKNGQRINIRVTIPRKDKIDDVSFTTGWMVEANGKLKLNTPYGGK